MMSRKNKNNKETDQLNHDFSHGAIPEQIMRMALPMTLAQLINLLYSVVDRIWLGRWQENGALALAAVGLAFPVIAVIIAFTNLCGAGSVPLFSIARGKGDNESAGLIMGNAYAALMILSVILTACGLAFKRPLLYLIGAGDMTIGYAEDYLTVYLCGTVFVMCGLGMNGFINAQGFAKIGMMTVLLGAILNIILDPIFIFYFGLGIKGAAIATVIGQMCSAIWVLKFLTGKKTHIRLSFRNMRLRFAVVKRSMALGFAGFTMQITNSLVGAVYNVLLQGLGGELYVSAASVIHSIQEIVQIPILGLRDAAQPVMSFNYGALRNDRVRWSMKFLSIAVFSVSVICWGIVMIFPEFFFRIFNGDPPLLSVGVPAARTYFALYFLMAFQVLGQAGYVSLGLTRLAIFFSILRKALIVCPFALLFGYVWPGGAPSVFFSEPISLVFGSITCYLVFMLTVWPKLKNDGSGVL
jgi:putative MATE family efflux protein